MNRYFPSGRFGYSMGYRSADRAYEALCDMCNECELTAGEAQIESYNAHWSPSKRVTRWAVTTSME